MSAQRRWDQRKFVIEESATSNGGKQTIFVETMNPGTSVPPHFHTRYFENLELVQGSIKVYQADQPDLAKLEASERQLQVGHPEFIIKPGLYHQYLVEDEVTTVRVTLTPGDLGFELMLKIINGLAEDGEGGKYSDSVIFTGIIFEIADANVIGPTKKIVDDAWATKGDEMLALKAELLEKYDTEEALRKLLPPGAVVA